VSERGETLAQVSFPEMEEAKAALHGLEGLIVVSPLIALMADQWRRLSADGHPAVMIASGLPDEVAPDNPFRQFLPRVVFCYSR
jgi:hypothetical protein